MCVKFKHAARKWYFVACGELEKLGCHRSSIGYSAFFWYHHNHFLGVFQYHVDDFLWRRGKKFNEGVVFSLCDKFKVGRRSVKQFKYVTSVSKMEK